MPASPELQAHRYAELDKRRRKAKERAVARKLKPQIVLRDGPCCHCGKLATHVDHWPIPLRDNGPSSLENLRLVCASCSLDNR